ncbi:MAG: DUF455 family protein [Bdellovibrionales bacterium]|nr:DUF455 family protein [Bdellovibrionales bacterium]
MHNPLLVNNIYEKISLIEEVCHNLLVGELHLEVPLIPGREFKMVAAREIPNKKGLSYREGQGQMLHDLASIELQAMELGLRTLADFPEAPLLFREQLVQIIIEESQHLKLCLKGLEQLGYRWGDWPAHVQLWASTSSEDDLLDRILIVHRYLEGSGLDASSILLKRLSSVDCPPLEKAIHKIAEDEESHVEFGSYWFQKNCKIKKLDSDFEFKTRFKKVLPRLPKRFERINFELRKKVGFTDVELQVLSNVREEWVESFKSK